jgi:hypothetical protein
MPRRMPHWTLRHPCSGCFLRCWSMVDLFRRRTRTSWVTSMGFEYCRIELTASSQPKGQSSYAVASSCVFVAPFDDTKIRDCCLEQFSVACNHDTGLLSYCALVPIFNLLVGSLLPSPRRVLAQIHLSRYSPTTTSALQCHTLPDRP